MLNRLVLLPTLVLGAFAGVLAWQNARLQDAADLVDHTDVVIAEINELTRMMVDEETGARGYVLNHDKAFLQPYEAAQADIPAQFESMQRLVADNPQQARRLRELEQAHGEWLQFTSARLSASGGPAEVDRAAREGKARMDRIRSMASQMLATESAVRDERTTRAKVSDRTVHIAVFIFALLGAVGLGLYTHICLRRLTSRYRSVLTELQSNEKQFRELAESIPQLAWMAHGDGDIFWYNRRWYDYTGATPEQMMGWGWRSVHDPALLPGIEAEWRKSISTGRPFEMVFPLRGADGQFRPFLTRIVPLLNDEGRVVRWFGTNTDITSEREAAEALHTSRETLRVALDASNTGTFRWDAESGQFLDVGQNLKGLFGLSSEQTFVSFDDLVRLVHPEDVEQVEATAESALTIDQFDMEFRVVHPDGSIHWLYDRAKRQIELPGRIFVGACTDVTQRKAAEDTLRRTEKLAIVGRMASSISHEINNPLAAITNLMYLIESAQSLDDVRAFAATAEKELGRVSQIVTQTLRFHRSSAKPNRFDVAQLLESAIALFEPHITGSGIQVDKSLQREVFLFGSDGELRQVLLNLIGNALDATRGVGRRLIVRERLGKDPISGQRGVRITIADDGHGMDESTARRIFQPFFSTKGESGTGLGFGSAKRSSANTTEPSACAAHKILDGMAPSSRSSCRCRRLRPRKTPGSRRLNRPFSRCAQSPRASSLCPTPQPRVVAKAPKPRPRHSPRALGSLRKLAHWPNPLKQTPARIPRCSGRTPRRTRPHFVAPHAIPRAKAVAGL